MPTKILVVEDESIVALDLQQRLITLGYDVPCVAATHDQTLNAVAETTPDIVLMDINIAGEIDGIDTAAELKTPVIYLTAYAEEKTLQRAKITRPYGYLIKPFSEKELHSTIQMALERHNYELQLKNKAAQLANVYTHLSVENEELMSTANELHSGKKRLELTLSSIEDGVITTDNQGNVTYLNPTAEQKTGWSSAQAVGQPISKILVLANEETQVLELSQIEQILFSKINAESSSRYNLYSRQGVISSIEHSVALMHDAEKNVVGVVLVFRDVSVARRQAKELAYLATHDDLTGLVNRSEFNKRLIKAIEKSQLLGFQHTVAYLDLDQFKIINDTCGHLAGDELLRQVVGLFCMVLRPSDTLARLGGDEFGLLIESCTPQFAQQLAENLRRAVSNFQFVWEDKTFPISVSIGLVSFGGKQAQAHNANEILRLADSACYIAKNQGRNRIHVYDADNSHLKKHPGQIDWNAKIYDAIKENRLVLYAQKIMTIRREPSRREHLEVLVRMIDRKNHVIDPIAFIPAAERHGLMPAIDRWVILTTFHHIAQLDQAAGLLFSINLSGASLNDPNCLNFILDHLNFWGISGQNICFEINETAAISNLLNARAFITKLQYSGIRFALDDFGSGMYSFSHLKQLPVNFLKIDGSFVKNMVNDDVDAAMVESINRIGHVLGMETIAEFVENDETILKLREMGVDFAQGYSIGQPVPLL